MNIKNEDPGPNDENILKMRITSEIKKVAKNKRQPNIIEKYDSQIPKKIYNAIWKRLRPLPS